MNHSLRHNRPSAAKGGRAGALAARAAAPAAAAGGDSAAPLLREIAQRQDATNRLLVELLCRSDAARAELKGIRSGVQALASCAEASQALLAGLLALCEAELRTIAAAARATLRATASRDGCERLRSALYCGRCCAHAALLAGAPRAAPRLLARACAAAGAGGWRAAAGGLARSVWALLGVGGAWPQAKRSVGLRCAASGAGARIPVRERGRGEPGTAGRNWALL
jgi:hypothetical protein